MSPEQIALRVRVGAVTLGSMLLIMVVMAVLLVVSDVRASRPGPQQPRATAASDGITAFAVDTLPALGVYVGSHCERTAYVIRSKRGSDVFVYTRNANGVLTDPD